MDFQFQIQQKPDYLHITVSGVNSKEVVAAYLKQVVVACSAHNARMS